MRPVSSCRQPRLPYTSPRAGSAMSSPRGVTRFRRVIASRSACIRLFPTHRKRVPWDTAGPSMSENARSVVVRESRGAVNFLWGFLVVVSIVVLWRAEFGSRTLQTRLVGGIVFRLLGVAAAAGWIWSRRHPGSIEVTPDTITLRRRG